MFFFALSVHKAIFAGSFARPFAQDNLIDRGTEYAPNKRPTLFFA
ncbi:hypothetical protein [Spirosoma horti]